MRYWLVASVLLSVLLLGCRRDSSSTATPAATIAGVPLQADALSHVTLLRNSAVLEGAFVQVAGQYKRLPLLVCNADAHVSPATWKLVAGDLEVLASGLDSQLRNLANPSQQLVVEGRWRRWEGPVGCGRRVPTQEIWYLDVSRIVSPNPLVALEEELLELPAGDQQLTPDNGGGDSENPTAITQLTVEFAPTGTTIAQISPVPPVDQFPTPAAAGTSTSTARPISPPTPTPFTTPITTTITTSTPLPGTTITTTTTPTSTVTLPADGTPLPTDSPGATSTPSQGGELFLDNLEIGVLSTSEEVTWQLYAYAGDVLTISAGPSVSLDLRLVLVDPNGAIIAESNDAGLSQGETIYSNPVAATGTYELRVSTVGSTSGSYGLNAADQLSEPVIVFRSALVYGNDGFGSLAADTDHLWGFEGKNGDVISIVAEPGSDEDLVIYLIGPGRTEIVFLDETIDGEQETLIDFELPSNGLYFIGIGESELDTASYIFTFDLVS